MPPLKTRLTLTVVLGRTSVGIDPLTALAEHVDATISPGTGFT
jgi:hypothetical protein